MSALAGLREIQGDPEASLVVQPSTRERLVTGSLYSFLAIVAGQGFALLTSIITARILGPESLGVLAIYAQIASLAVGLASAGLSVAVAKFTAQLRVSEKNRLEQFLSTVLALALAVSLSASFGFWIAAGSIGLSLYGSSEMVLMIQLMSAFLVLNSLSAFGGAVLQGLQAYRTLSLIGIMIEALGVPTLFIFLNEFGVVGAVVSGVVLLLVGTALTFGLALSKLKRTGIRLSISVEPRALRQFLLFTSPLLVSSVALQVAGVFQNSYLEAQLGFTDVGFYKVATTLYRVVLFVPSAMSVPLLPIASETFAKDTVSRARAKLTSILRVSAFLGVPVALLLGFGAYLIIGILYGDGYLGAAPLGFLLTVAGFAEIVDAVAMNALLGEGRTFLLLGVNMTQAIILVGGTVFFVNTFGLMGIGLAVLLNSATYGTILLVVLSRSGRIAARSSLEPLLVACVVFLAAIAAFYSATDSLRTVLGAGIVMAYGVVAWRLMSSSERNVFKELSRQVGRWLHV